MIEMMIAVVIVGIMAAMSIPKFQTAFERMKFRSANKDITSTLRLVRSMAITEKQYYGVHIDNVSRTLTLFKKNPADSLVDQFTDGDEVIQVDSLNQTFDYMGTALVNQAMVFKPNGGTTFLGYGYIVTYSYSEDMVGIYVNHVLASTGRIKGIGYYY